MNTRISNPTRRYELDWLRVAAILSVFLYHSTRFFNLGDWHVKNIHTYMLVEQIEKVMEIWMMPIIFVISGAAMYLAMNKSGSGIKGAALFFKDKLFRLVIPLVVVIFTHASLQVYLERISHGQFSGSYFQWLPQYFDGMYMNPGEGGNFAWAGMHMWYVLFLLVFMIVLYAPLAWLKFSGKKVYQWLGVPLTLPITFFLLALPLAIVDPLISGTPFNDMDPGGWDMPYYIIFFVAGFLIVGQTRLLASIEKNRWFNMVIGIIMAAAYMFFRNNTRPSLVELSGVMDGLSIFLASWAGILAILGFGMKHLNFSNPLLKYANDAVLPFYILHQTVLLVVGYAVLRWHIPDLLKWAVIVTLSFTLIMGIYDLLVRRINLLRFMFGMKAIKKEQLQEQPSAVPAQ